MRIRLNAVRVVAVAIVLMCSGPAFAARAPVPDLTGGGRKDRSHDWTLGPTGARGWIWGRDLETTDARQILITMVEKGSPADGVLEPGDVIFRVNGKPFDSDARRAFGRAITEAETTQNKGILKLIRWRKGVQSEIPVQLKVMGGYSGTSPYDCPKSRLILEDACRYLAQRPLREDIVGDVSALAMLASGKPEFLDKVRTLARRIGPANLKLELKSDMYAWEWGYANLFLTEYYPATADKEVLPAGT